MKSLPSVYEFTSRHSTQYTISILYSRVTIQRRVSVRTKKGSGPASVSVSGDGRGGVVVVRYQGRLGLTVSQSVSQSIIPLQYRNC